MESELLVTHTEGIARIRFNRPASRNAFTNELMVALRRAFDSANADPAVRCIVLDGVGDHFMSGGNVKAWGELLGASPEEREAYFKTLMGLGAPLFASLVRLTKPFIVGVRGYAAGAGLSFVTSADFVIADDTARFLFANVRIALAPDACLSYNLPRIVGRRQAARLCMLGSDLNAVQARDLGIVDEIVAPGAFEEAVMTLATTLAGTPARAMREIKRLMHASENSTPLGQYALETEAILNCVVEDEFVEAVAAFTERRKPSFEVLTDAEQRFIQRNC
jgi:2-(1,2-epoxy-1,2-dihydrophenyl)acetyl-CoA isomerase